MRIFHWHDQQKLDLLNKMWNELFSPGLLRNAISKQTTGQDIISKRAPAPHGFSLGRTQYAIIWQKTVTLIGNPLVWLLWRCSYAPEHSYWSSDINKTCSNIFAVMDGVGGSYWRKSWRETVLIIDFLTHHWLESLGGGSQAWVGWGLGGMWS